MPDFPKQDEDLGLHRQRVGGRFVTAYDPGVALKVCELVAEGLTLSEICKPGGGMPHRQTFHRWVVADVELQKAYMAARELSAHSMEEEALDIARELRKEGDLSSAKVRAYDVAMNQLRWSASRRNPRVYSERGQLQITVPIQINTSLNLDEGPPPEQARTDNVYDVKGLIELPASEIHEITKEQPQQAKLTDRKSTARTGVGTGRKPSAEKMAAARKAYAEKHKNAPKGDGAG